MSRNKKLYSVISLILFLLFMGAGTIFLWRFLGEFNADPASFQEAIDAYGQGNNAVIFIVMQMLQIVFPILPGEVVELAAGYLFGPFVGLLLCEVGILLASVPVFFLSKRLGDRIISNLFSAEKIKSLSFLQNEKRLTLIVFLLFFLPGTPKDLLTYFVGLTPMKASRFIPITLFARIPSILTSTFAGASMGTGDSHRALLIYGVTAAVSLIGVLVYSAYVRKKAAGPPDKPS